MTKHKNYDKAIIYGILCNKTHNLYIGSSCQSLAVRRQQHWSDYKGYCDFWFGWFGNTLEYRNYRSSFEVLINEDYKFFKIMDWPCKNRAELQLKEEQTRVAYDDSMFYNVVNKSRASIYYKKNKNICPCKYGAKTLS
tara:strand:- start:20 stop:433 length:414 start_codon:yes stop_codon:yes gene_type:complete